MRLLQQYVSNVLGAEIQYEPINKQELGMFPLFLSETYRLYHTALLNQALIMVEKIDQGEFSILQIEKHLELIREAFNRKTILLAWQMTALNRKRLVEKGINFIVPGKQIYLPDLLIDLREDFRNSRNILKKETLLPSAQFIVLYRILHDKKKGGIETMSFRELAVKLKYSPMAITNAAENLKYHEICTIVGEKEKNLQFSLDNHDMWYELEHRNLFVNPVLKRVFVDEIDGNPFCLLSNGSALPEYTDINPSRQQFRAIEKNAFYQLQNESALHNLNDVEGILCLEVWKYDPKVLIGELPNDLPAVDPLSLYLSLKDSTDERIEMSFEQLIEKGLWL